MVLCLQYIMMQNQRLTWYPLFVSATVIFLDTAGYSVIVPLIPDFVVSLDLNAIQVSALFSVYGLVLLVVPIPLGILADRIDRKRFLYISLCVKACALFGLSLADSYAELMILRIVDAAAGAATWTICLALTADFYPQESIGSKFGIIIAASEAGSFAGPLISGPMADWFDSISAPFIFMSSLCVLAISLLLFLAKPKDTTSSRSPMQEIRSLLSNRKILTVGMLFFIGAFFVGMLESIYPVYLGRTLNFSRTQIGITFAVLTGTFVLLMPLAGALSSKYRASLFITTGLVITSISLPGLVFFQAAKILSLFLICQAMGWALFFAPAFPIFTQEVKNAGSGSGIAFGLSNVFWAAGFMIGPVIGGLLMELGGIQLPFTLMGFALLFLIMIFQRPNRKKKPT